MSLLAPGTTHDFLRTGARHDTAGPHRHRTCSPARSPPSPGGHLLRVDLRGGLGAVAAAGHPAGPDTPGPRTAADDPGIRHAVRTGDHPGRPAARPRRGAAAAAP